MAIVIATGSIAAAQDGNPRIIDFGEGKWDQAAWSPVALAPQEEPGRLVQRADAIGSDPFTEAQLKARTDNALLMTDIGLTDGQIELTFTIGPEPGAAPGFAIGPVVKDGRLQSAFAVFVADYTMAVWHAKLDPDTNKMTYAPLARLNRWSAPGERHTVRCRFKKLADNSYDIALQLDDSDVLMLQRREQDEPLNSQFILWGCHGRCDFHALRLLSEGTLGWSAKKPGE